MVFVDGNHRWIPTLRYFETLMPMISESGMIIFDDIHWSGEMEDAWAADIRKINGNAECGSFFCGHCFFSKRISG